MGLDKLTVDTIDKDNARLEAKINNFLEDHNLPAFESDTETAIFLVEALKAASLPNIAAEVRRDLENALNLEGSYVSCVSHLLSCTSAFPELN